jgi:hypothetical protein
MSVLRTKEDSKQYGKHFDAIAMTTCVNRATKEFKTKWYPRVEFDGRMCIVSDKSRESGLIECDSKEEALYEAREFLDKMMEKYPEDFK